MFIQVTLNIEWKLIYNTMYEEGSCHNFVCEYCIVHENY